MNNTFNNMAEKYDTKDRKALADVITGEIVKVLNHTHYSSLIDYGGVTGLVGLELADYFETGVLIDASPEMINIARQKITSQNINHFEAEVLNLSDEDHLNVQADVIVLSLVLIHVPDFKHLLKQLSRNLNTDGRFIIVDFDKNPRVTHPKVHNGFNETELNDALTEAGLTPLERRTFHHGKNIFVKEDASLFISTSTK
ncbi:class I SAM-dependent DNA methyltransferase [Corticicoccus populi]|uniref:Class I SAM-dependent DNA methyltransferase n=1 Tax=Corticicoccus populi TaxID=1812821 RepID=A0ABW5X0C4_9STAP